jgi:alkylation response protein AidB-like acyl-CoA dehydrogenase
VVIVSSTLDRIVIKLEGKGMEIEQHQLNVSRVGVVSGLTGLSERGAGGCDGAVLGAALQF